MIELSIDNLPSSLTELLFTGESFSLELQTTEYNQSLRYIGVHEFIPGVPTTTMADTLVIGETAWRALVGDSRWSNHNSTTWMFTLEFLAQWTGHPSIARLKDQED